MLKHLLGSRSHEWHIASEGIIRDVWITGEDLMAVIKRKEIWDMCMMTKELMAFNKRWHEMRLSNVSACIFQMLGRQPT